MAAGETVVQADVINFYKHEPLSTGRKTIVNAIIITSLVWALITAAVIGLRLSQNEDVHDIVVGECREQLQQLQTSYVQ